MRTTFGQFFSEGSRLLWEAMDSRGLSQRQLGATLLGPSGKPLSNGQVDGWLYGTSRPGVTSAEQLLEKYGIPIGSWRQKPAKDFARLVFRGSATAA